MRCIWYIIYGNRGGSMAITNLLVHLYWKVEDEKIK
jgi:hypothetical protein